MNLQLFSAMRESGRRRNVLQSRFKSVDDMYDRHDTNEPWTWRDVVWCAVVAVAVYALLTAGMSL